MASRTVISSGFPPNQIRKGENGLLNKANNVIEWNLHCYRWLGCRNLELSEQKGTWIVHQRPNCEPLTLYCWLFAGRRPDPSIHRAYSARPPTVAEEHYRRRRLLLVIWRPHPEWQIGSDLPIPGCKNRAWIKWVTTMPVRFTTCRSKPIHRDPEVAMQAERECWSSAVVPPTYELHDPSSLPGTPNRQYWLRTNCCIHGPKWGHMQCCFLLVVIERKKCIKYYNIYRFKWVAQSEVIPVIGLLDCSNSLNAAERRSTGLRKLHGLLKLAILSIDRIRE